MIGGRGALIALVIVAAAACAGPGSAPKQRMPDGALALVDGEPIMEAELQETIVAFRAENRQTRGSGLSDDELAKQFLPKLIDNRLMLQEADREKVTVADKEVSDEISERIKVYNTKSIAEFEKLLKEQGITMEAVRKRVREALRVQKLLRRKVALRVSVTDAEIMQYLQENGQKLESAVVARQILISPETSSEAAWEAARMRAQTVREQLVSGADFFALAQQLKRSGGAEGQPKRSEARDMDSAILRLKAGDVSDVYRSTQGFHIFRQEFLEVSQDDARRLVRELLFRDKYEARRQAWLNELRQRSFIVTRNVSTQDATSSIVRPKAKPSTDEYLETMRTKIKSRWTYPCVEDPATRRCNYLTVGGTLDMTLDADGRVTLVTIVDSSGYREYDRALVVAVQLASPFTPPSNLATTAVLPLRFRARFSYVNSDVSTSIQR